ncbi:MAG: nuclear transport factor 2 family protein [Gemmatimonadales bacterium]|jgi:ketosteroid isomerase-like protein
MRYRLLILIAALAALGCSARPGQLGEAERAVIVRDVRQAIDDLFAAMNAHDADAVLAHYRAVDDFAYVGVTDLQVGPEPFSARMRTWHDAHPDVVFDHQIVHIQVLSPTVAVAVVRGSSTDAEVLTWTQVFVRDDGAWRIAHEHEAWPGSEPTRGPHPGT